MGLCASAACACSLNVEDSDYLTRSGSGSAGDPFVVGLGAYVARGEIGFASRTTVQSAIGTSPTDITSLTTTVTIPANRRIMITGFGLFEIAATAVAATFAIYEGATQLSSVGVNLSGAAYIGGIVQAVIAPSAASHTYKLRAAANAGTVNFRADATYPGFILVEDIGSSL